MVTVAYDLADRTTSITPTGGTASTVALDALGRVRTRTTGASVDTYSYAGPTNNVVRIANAGGSGTTTDSVLDPSGLRFGTKTGATVAWLLADLHGSVAVGLNQAGTTVTDALRYDGAGMTVAVYPGGGSAATRSWKYQGRLDVAASGPSLYDFEAREMSPGLGAFTSNDTVLGSATNPRQLNRYVYAKANPRSFIDPDGHCSFSLDADDPCEGTAGWSSVSYDEFMQQQAQSAWANDQSGADFGTGLPTSVESTTGGFAFTPVAPSPSRFDGQLADSVGDVYCFNGRCGAKSSFETVAKIESYAPEQERNRQWLLWGTIGITALAGGALACVVVCSAGVAAAAGAGRGIVAAASRIGPAVAQTATKLELAKRAANTIGAGIGYFGGLGLSNLASDKWVMDGYAHLDLGMALAQGFFSDELDARDGLSVVVGMGASAVSMKVGDRDNALEPLITGLASLGAAELDNPSLLDKVPLLKKIPGLSGAARGVGIGIAENFATNYVNGRLPQHQ